jgi:hypothetical protein
MPSLGHPTYEATVGEQKRSSGLPRSVEQYLAPITAGHRRDFEVAIPDAAATREL